MAGRKRTSTLREKEIMEQKGEQNKKRQRIQGERKAPLLPVVKNKHADPVKMATEEASDGLFTAVPHFRNEEQGEKSRITFPDFELVACEKCRHFTSDDALVPALLYKLHCLVTHSEIDDRMAKKSKR
jgi:hypothetical protein